MRPFRRQYSFRVYRLPKRFFRKVLVFSLLLLVISAGFLFKFLPQQNLVALASIKSVGVIDVANNDLEGVLDSSIPMLAVSKDGSKAGISERYLSNAFYYLVGIQLGKPFTFLQAEIPYLENISYKVATADDIIAEDPKDSGNSQEENKAAEEKTVNKDAYEEKSQEEEEKNINAAKLAIPLVAIYSTHTGETYSLTDGVVRKKGEKGGVVQVGQEIKRVLEQDHGIGVIHSDVIHDYDYTEVYPYGASQKTAQKILKENPSVKIIIDLHRDAVSGMKRDQITTEIDGQKYAKLFFVVGSNQRQTHPNWEKNYEFAKKISAKVDEMYPGLLRKAPAVQGGIYNQNLHPNALLVEFGEADSSYTEECIRSAQVFAHVLAEVLKDME